MRYKLLLDFDGTITVKDTCVAMLDEFAVSSWEDLDEKWASGTLTTKECAYELFKIMKFTQGGLVDFLKTLSIDTYFDDLVMLCLQKDIETVIVSDGYDFNINNVLGANTDHKIRAYSNSLSFDDKGEYVLNFPNYNHECGKCGTCKRNIYGKYKDDCDVIIYVGDGYSDRCVAEVADVLFAKGSLAKHCDKKEIKYNDFNSFKDVMDYIESLNDN